MKLIRCSKSEQVLQNPMGADELLESLHGSNSVASKQQQTHDLSLGSKDDSTATDNVLAQQEMHQGNN